MPWKNVWDLCGIINIAENLTEIGFTSLHVQRRDKENWSWALWNEEIRRMCGIVWVSSVDIAEKLAEVRSKLH
jgi:hypothetical protein